MDECEVLNWTWWMDECEVLNWTWWVDRVSSVEVYMVGSSLSIKCVMRNFLQSIVLYRLNLVHQTYHVSA